MGPGMVIFTGLSVQLCATSPVVRKEVAPGADGSSDGRQLRGVDPAYPLFGQILEVEAGQVAAVIVDIVFTTHFAVGRDVDAGAYLVLDHLLDAAGENRLRFIAHRLDGIGPAAGRLCRVGAGRGLEPVGNLDVIGLRISADGGRRERHGVPSFRRVCHTRRRVIGGRKLAVLHRNRYSPDALQIHGDHT